MFLRFAVWSVQTTTRLIARATGKIGVFVILAAKEREAELSLVTISHFRQLLHCTKARFSSMYTKFTVAPSQMCRSAPIYCWCHFQKQYIFYVLQFLGENRFCEDIFDETGFLNAFHLPFFKKKYLENCGQFFKNFCYQNYWEIPYGP